MNAHSVHMVFSPQSCSLALLDAMLTEERRALAEQILQQIRSGVTRKTASHTLIVGPRGCGKTHLLAFVRKTLETSGTATPELILMPLAEEEHGLRTLLDFLLTALRSCGHDIRALNPQFGAQGREVALFEAIAAFDHVTAGRTVLILLENLNAVFATLEEGQVDRLRAFLQSRPRVALLASAVELFADSSRPDHPFHGFFLIQPLKPLSRKEARAYLAQLARSKGDDALEAAIRGRGARQRVDAICDLTGGNHRLLAMLNTFLTVDGFAELVGPFVQMVDRELTPYYQQRLDRLSPQQKKILMAIAGHHGRALSVKEIAAYTFSSSQVVSRQLTDLIHGAHVRRTRLGRESFYELNEPLLRLVLDIKEGRDRPLPLIVAFLRRWYDLRELQQLEDRAPAIVKKYYTTAVEQTIGEAEPGIGETRERTGAPVTGPVDAQDDKQQENEEVLSYFARAFALDGQGRPDEEIAVYDEVLHRFGESERPELLEQVAQALFNKGITLGRRNRSEEEIAVYDEVLRRFGASEQPELLEQVARALVSKASAEMEQGRLLESLALSERALSLAFHRSEALQVRLRAMFRVGDLRGSFQLLREQLSSMGPEDPLRSRLVTLVLEENHTNLVALRELADLYREEPDPLSLGLLGWVQEQLPMSEAKARALEITEQALAESLGPVPGCSLALQLLSAVRRHALGERDALFRLPLEIRRLVSSEPE